MLSSPTEGSPSAVSAGRPPVDSPDADRQRAASFSPVPCNHPANLRLEHRSIERSVSSEGQLQQLKHLKQQYSEVFNLFDEVRVLEETNRSLKRAQEQKQALLTPLLQEEPELEPAQPVSQVQSPHHSNVPETDDESVASIEWPYEEGVLASPVPLIPIGGKKQRKAPDSDSEYTPSDEESDISGDDSSEPEYSEAEPLQAHPRARAKLRPYREKGKLVAHKSLALPAQSSVPTSGAANITVRTYPLTNKAVFTPDDDYDKKLAEKILGVKQKIEDTRRLARELTEPYMTEVKYLNKHNFPRPDSWQELEKQTRWSCGLFHYAAFRFGLADTKPMQISDLRMFKPDRGEFLYIISCIADDKPRNDTGVLATDFQKNRVPLPVNNLFKGIPEKWGAGIINAIKWYIKGEISLSREMTNVLKIINPEHKNYKHWLASQAHAYMAGLNPTTKAWEYKLGDLKTSYNNMKLTIPPEYADGATEWTQDIIKTILEDTKLTLTTPSGKPEKAAKPAPSKKTSKSASTSKARRAPKRPRTHEAEAAPQPAKKRKTGQRKSKKQ